MSEYNREGNSRCSFSLPGKVRARHPPNFQFPFSDSTRRPHARSSSLANFQRLIFSVSIYRSLLHCKYFPGTLTATRIFARPNLPSLDLSPDRPSPRPPKYHILLLYQKAQIFVRLAIETKGYSQVMPLIVESSRTMSSPESRSVKRPSESASCIPLFCCFLSELKIWRMLCLLGFSSTTTRAIAQSIKINLRTSKTFRLPFPLDQHISRINSTRSTSRIIQYNSCNRN